MIEIDENKFENSTQKKINVKMSNMDMKIIINKNIKVKSHKIRVNKNNIEKLIKNFDIVCDGTDNFKTRLLVNDHALKQKKILISAAVSGFDGHIFKFNFKKKTPCYRCFLPEIPEQSIPEIPTETLDD